MTLPSMLVVVATLIFTGGWHIFTTGISSGMGVCWG